jgi:hypothetical protein
VNEYGNTKSEPWSFVMIATDAIKEMLRASKLNFGNCRIEIIVWADHKIADNVAQYLHATSSLPNNILLHLKKNAVVHAHSQARSRDL